MRFFYIILLSFILLFTGCNNQLSQNNQLIDTELNKEDITTSTNNTIKDQLTMNVIDFTSGANKEYLTNNTRMLHPVSINNSDDNYIMLYGIDNHTLFNIDKREERKISVYNIENSNYYDNWLGYDELYSNRFYESFTYMVKGHRELYRVDLLNNELEKIYEAPNAIYGITSSPDSAKIAILYSHDSYIGPNADLIILNQEGESELFIENATKIDHSDGVIAGFYPIYWDEDNQIILGTSSTEENLSGMKILNLETGGFTNYINDENKIELEKRILEHENTTYLYQLVWSPNKAKIAYNSANELRVYDIEDDNYIFLGEGKIIYWIDDNRLVWY